MIPSGSRLLVTEANIDASGPKRYPLPMKRELTDEHLGSTLVLIYADCAQQRRFRLPHDSPVTDKAGAPIDNAATALTDDLATRWLLKLGLSVIKASLGLYLLETLALLFYYSCFNTSTWISLGLKRSSSGVIRLSIHGKAALTEENWSSQTKTPHVASSTPLKCSF